ncbi:hypothetical protein [Chitinophaga nivalis]|uniref:Uncharacterized protein n=1 Tax=Chitinophaga nivalis TaxID=2991709 RepID=A0ABT3IRF9_9BACT|nr:hypothetical protein [Chitinophaga nivalis]MCW3463753.1 hypothetical protein [Chitinophaga nivalis]MCW3486557.1 hypothetical protein [Chitinophaga nivalis]
MLMIPAHNIVAIPYPLAAIGTNTRKVKPNTGYLSISLTEAA